MRAEAGYNAEVQTVDDPAGTLVWAGQWAATDQILLAEGLFTRVMENVAFVVKELEEVIDRNR